MKDTDEQLDEEIHGQSLGGSCGVEVCQPLRV